MQKNISSKLTPLMKIIFPSILSIIFVFLGLTKVFTFETELLTKIIFSIFGLAGIFLIWTSLTLKKVSLTENSLMVSNFVKQIHLPLSEIKEVEQSRWLQTLGLISYRPVYI